MAVSSLAEGADRLVARELLAKPTSRLEVILPVARPTYACYFHATPSPGENSRTCWSAPARSRHAPGRPTRQEAYDWAGRRWWTGVTH